MLHLFNKLYIDFEETISLDFDRVVISANNGFGLKDGITKIHGGNLLGFATSYDELIGVGKSYPNFFTFIHSLKNVDKTTIIYTDKANFYKVVANWYKVIMPNATADEVSKYVKSNWYRAKVWSVSRRRIAQSVVSIEHETFDSDLLTTEWNNVTVNSSDWTDFITEQAGKFSIELLLASYIKDGSRKSELKSIMKVLLKKQIENTLYELKEEVVSNLNNKSYMTALGASTYDIDTFYNAIDDTALSPFFKSTIWKSEYIKVGSSKQSIDISAVTADDITAYKNLYTTIGQTDYMMEIKLLDYIDFVKGDGELSDTQLDQIIQDEIDNPLRFGSFYGPSLESVNTYFVDHILQQKKDNNTDSLNPYVV